MLSSKNFDTSVMRPFDMANYIETPEDVYGFLNASLNDQDKEGDFDRVWDMLARSKGMAILLKQAKQDKAILQQNPPANFVGMLNTLKILGFGLQLVDKKSVIHH